MTATRQPTMEMYQLDPEGRSYKAAITLYLAAQRIAERWNGDFRLAHRGLFETASERRPELLRAIGLLSPATQIHTNKDEAPRAYLTYPTVFVTAYTPANGKPALYLDAPIDYKGGHFAPADARKLDEKETIAVGHLIGGGGWNTPDPVLFISNTGIAMPEDFDMKKHRVVDSPFKPDYKTLCFIAEGRSLEIVEDFKRREREWRAACDTMRRIIEETSPRAYSDRALDQRASGEGFYMNSSIGHEEGPGRKTYFEISIRQNGNLDPADKSCAIKLVDNPVFTVSDTKHGGYLIKPNESTPEGTAFKKLFDAMPSAPDKTDYPEIIAPKGGAPIIQTLAGKTVLVYHEKKRTGLSERGRRARAALPKIARQWQVAAREVLLRHPAELPRFFTDYAENLLRKNLKKIIERARAGKKPFFPPDAQSLDTRLRNWLNQDKQENEIGIRPPPMPADLAKLFAAQFDEAKTAEAQKPPPPVATAKPASPGS